MKRRYSVVSATSSSSGSARMRKLASLTKGRRRVPRRQSKKKTSKKGYRKVYKGGLTRGIHISNETHGQVSSGTGTGQAVYIGHATCPSDLVLFAMSLGIIKALAVKMGLQITALGETVEYGQTGDIYRLVYNANPGAAISTIDLTYTSATSWNALANSLYTNLSTLGQQAELNMLTFIPFTASKLRMTRMDLQASSIKMSIKSVITLQNVSIPATDEDEIDEVDAVYLRGISYVGKGTGTAIVKPLSQFTTDVGLYGRQDDGLINRTSASAQISKELFRPCELYNVQKSKKIAMGPGQIQSSGLKEYFSMKMFKFWDIVNRSRTIAGGITAQNDQTFGKYAIHAFEHAITATLQPILLNYQLDIHLDCLVNPANTQVTTQAVILNDVIVQ